ncbi:hypothetical protein C8Q75DRAFT_719488 [Abortiporus biennis]|nr:hypothetical protein C8Q75DRAFT_719488 [Abortiporus biennis]
MASPESSLQALNRPLDNPQNAEPVKKRKRGATRLSCAECRRLKLRCDRAIPCGSCVKRGCAAICPEGSLQTGKGNRSTRFVLASTQDLHEKIQELSNRVRELEDGLRTSHSAQSTAPHPLLSEELLRIKAPLQREGLNNQTTNGDSATDGQSADVVDSFGSLSISEKGLTSYYGQATSSWNETTDEVHADDGEERLNNLRRLLPQEILALSGVFPVTAYIPPTIEIEEGRLQCLRSLYWYLPPADEAAELRQIYYEHAAWMYNPISSVQFNENVYNQFYSPNAAPPSSDPSEVHQWSHRLALMFMVLAIGSLMDTRRPAYNIEAEKYHHLARAALFQSPIFEQPTLNAVQSLYLMAFFLFLTERHGTGVGSRWALMGLAVKLGVSVHRDAGRWRVGNEEVMRRRELFWEIYSYDMLQSYTLGRPQSFSLTHVDCKRPYEEDPHNDETFHWWKHRFASECMNTVYDQVFGAKTPTYSTVLQMDRKLRAFQVPPLLQIAGFGNAEASNGASYDSVPLILQRHVVLAVRESMLLYMHRGFYARALTDHPKDPLGSPYGSSFIAAYRSAGSLVALVQNIHSQLKEITERMWFLWTHLFSCAIILGSIVTKCPTMSLAPSALNQLTSACNLFSKVAHLFNAQPVLIIMQNLRERAHMILEASRNPSSSMSMTPSSIKAEPQSPADDEDELAILGGRTRTVAPKEKSLSPSLAERSPTSHNPIVPLPLMQGGVQQQVHPYVLHYLRQFAPPTQSLPQIDTSYGQKPMISPITTSTTSTSSSPQFGLDHLSVSYAQQSPAQQQQQQQMMMGGLSPGGIPEYFPVFDYNAGVGGVDPFANLSMEGDISGRYSPESTMQKAWQDLLTQVSM